MPLTVPQDLEPLFLAAGWHPGRSVAVPADVPAGHPAAEVLASLANLSVNGMDAGEECATSSIEFGAHLYGDPDQELYDAALGERLVSVGELDGGYALLFIDGKGRWFAASVVHQAFWLCGESMADALRCLLFGRRGRPVLLSGQTSVDLYGDAFDAQHPATYRP